MLQGFCDLSSFPLVPVGLALLDALEGSVGCRVLGDYLLCLQGILYQTGRGVLPTHDSSQRLSVQEGCVLCLGLTVEVEIQGFKFDLKGMP